MSVPSGAIPAQPAELNIPLEPITRDDGVASKMSTKDSGLLTADMKTDASNTESSLPAQVSPISGLEELTLAKDDKLLAFEAPVADLVEAQTDSANTVVKTADEAITISSFSGPHASIADASTNDDTELLSDKAALLADATAARATTPPVDALASIDAKEVATPTSTLPSDIIAVSILSSLEKDDSVGSIGAEFADASISDVPVKPNEDLNILTSPEQLSTGVLVEALLDDVKDAVENIAQAADAFIEQVSDDTVVETEPEPAVTNQKIDQDEELQMSKLLAVQVDDVKPELVGQTNESGLEDDLRSNAAIETKPKQDAIPQDDSLSATGQVTLEATKESGDAPADGPQSEVTEAAILSTTEGEYLARLDGAAETEPVPDNATSDKLQTNEYKEGVITKDAQVQPAVEPVDVDKAEVASVRETVEAESATVTSPSLVTIESEDKTTSAQKADLVEGQEEAALTISEGSIHDVKDVLENSNRVSVISEAAEQTTVLPGEEAIASSETGAESLLPVVLAAAVFGPQVVEVPPSTFEAGVDAHAIKDSNSAVDEGVIAGAPAEDTITGHANDSGEPTPEIDEQQVSATVAESRPVTETDVASVDNKDILETPKDVKQEESTVPEAESVVKTTAEAPVSNDSALNDISEESLAQPTLEEAPALDAAVSAEPSLASIIPSAATLGVQVPDTPQAETEVPAVHSSQPFSLVDEQSPDSAPEVVPGPLGEDAVLEGSSASRANSQAEEGESKEELAPRPAEAEVINNVLTEDATGATNPELKEVIVEPKEVSKEDVAQGIDEDVKEDAKEEVREEGIKEEVKEGIQEEIKEAVTEEVKEAEAKEEEAKEEVREEIAATEEVKQEIKQEVTKEIKEEIKEVTEEIEEEPKVELVTEESKQEPSAESESPIPANVEAEPKAVLSNDEEGSESKDNVVDELKVTEALAPSAGATDILEVKDTVSSDPALVDAITETGNFKVELKEVPVDQIEESAELQEKGTFAETQGLQEAIQTGESSQLEPTSAVAELQKDTSQTETKDSSEPDSANDDTNAKALEDQPDVSEPQDATAPVPSAKVEEDAVGNQSEDSTERPVLEDETVEKDAVVPVALTISQEAKPESSLKAEAIEQETTSTDSAGRSIVSAAVPSVREVVTRSDAAETAIDKGSEQVTELEDPEPPVATIVDATPNETNESAVPDGQAAVPKVSESHVQVEDSAEASSDTKTDVDRVSEESPAVEDVEPALSEAQAEGIESVPPAPATVELVTTVESTPSVDRDPQNRAFSEDKEDIAQPSQYVATDTESSTGSVIEPITPAVTVEDLKIEEEGLKEDQEVERVIPIEESSTKIERSKSPYPSTFEVTRIGGGNSAQGEPQLVDEAIIAAPIPVVIAPVPDDTVAHTVDQDSVASPPSRPWTPSYSVHSQGSPMISPQDDSTVPDEPQSGSILAAEDIATVEHVDETKKFAQSSAPVNVAQASDEKSGEQVSSPSWVPSYSVSRQGSPLVKSRELEVPPVDDKKTEIKVESEPSSVEVQSSQDVNTISKDILLSAETLAPQSNDVFQQLADVTSPVVPVTVAEESAKKLDIIKVVDTVDGTSEQVQSGGQILTATANDNEEAKSTLAPLHEGLSVTTITNGASPLILPDISAGRSRLESTASSKFFPGGWFSAASKIPADEGRASFETATGEFVPNKTPVSPSEGSAAVLLPIATEDLTVPLRENGEESASSATAHKRKWCVVM